MTLGQRFRNLRKVIFDGNPITAITEFAFNGDDENLNFLTEVSFESCTELGYVDDAAFYYVKSIANISFKNSGLFYLSSRAFYECPALTTVDISNTAMKYLESDFVVYSDSIESLTVSDLECS